MKLTVLIFIMMFSSLALARPYKCEVDGKVTYSQTRCSDESFEKVRIYDKDKYHLKEIIEAKDKAFIDTINGDIAINDAEFKNKRQNLEALLYREKKRGRRLEVKRLKQELRDLSRSYIDKDNNRQSGLDAKLKTHQKEIDKILKRHSNDR